MSKKSDLLLDKDFNTSAHLLYGTSKDEEQPIKATGVLILPLIDEAYPPIFM